MSAVRCFEVTLTPAAECADCEWSIAPATVLECRAHVTATGHHVIRTRKTRAEYYPIPLQRNQETTDDD